MIIAQDWLNLKKAKEEINKTINKSITEFFKNNENLTEEDKKWLKFRLLNDILQDNK